MTITTVWIDEIFVMLLLESESDLEFCINEMEEWS